MKNIVKSVFLGLIFAWCGLSNATQVYVNNTTDKDLVIYFVGDDGKQSGRVIRSKSTDGWFMTAGPLKMLHGFFEPVKNVDGRDARKGDPVDPKKYNPGAFTERGGWYYLDVTGQYVFKGKSGDYFYSFTVPTAQIWEMSIVPRVEAEGKQINS